MENFNIDSFAADVTNAIAKVKEIVDMIHNLVGDIMGVFAKECALCGEIHE